MRTLTLNEIQEVNGGLRAIVAGIISAAIYDGIKSYLSSPSDGAGPAGGGGGGGGGR